MRNHLNDLTKYKIYTHSTFRRLLVRQLKRQLISERQNQHSFFSFLIVRLTSLMYNFISNVKMRITFPVTITYNDENYDILFSIHLH